MARLIVDHIRDHLRERHRKYSLNFESREIRYPVDSPVKLFQKGNKIVTSHVRSKSVQRITRVISSVSRIAWLFESELNE